MTILRALLLLAWLASPAVAQGPAVEVAPRALKGTGAAEPDGVFPRRLRDEMGEVTIPVEPKRLVAIQPGQLEALLTLGITPVGAGRGSATKIYDDYQLEAFPEAASGIRAMTDIGSLQEPDLEAIAALKPDLIFYTRAALKETTYRALSAIAPVVVAKGMGMNWKVDFLLVGHAVGKAGAAQAFLDRYHAEAEAFAARWRERTPPTVSFVNVTGDRVRLFGRHAFAGGVAEDLGLARPPEQRFEGAAQDLSAEMIDRADADFIFYAARNDDFSALRGSALWPTLTAVAAGRAQPVGFKLFFNAGPMAAKLVSERLQQVITSK